MCPIRPRPVRVLVDAVVLFATATAAVALVPSAVAAVPTAALLTAAAAPSPGTAPDPLSPGLPRPPLGSGQRSVTVAVGGGFQAAVYDERGHVTFWSRSAVSHHWATVGSSAHPVLSPSSGPRIHQALGVLPTGMHDAVFVLRGYFTGDGDADNLAFATGRHGWGQLEPKGNTLVPTGRGSTAASGAAGLALHVQLSHGMLETSQGSDVVSVAQAALLPVNRFYRWTRHALVRDHDNILNAVRSRGPSPDRRITALPNCAVVRSDGVYDAPEDARSGRPATPFAINDSVPVTVRLFTRNGRVCSFTVPASQLVSVPVTVTRGVTPWITAPVWMLTTSGSLGNPWGDLQGATGSPSVSMASFVPRGAATWFVPPWLHVRALAPTGVESPVASAVVQVRFRGGHLAALTVFRNSASSD